MHTGKSYLWDFYHALHNLFRRRLTKAALLSSAVYPYYKPKDEKYNGVCVYIDGIPVEHKMIGGKISIAGSIPVGSDVTVRHTVTQPKSFFTW